MRSFCEQKSFFMRLGNMRTWSTVDAYTCGQKVVGLQLHQDPGVAPLSKVNNLRNSANQSEEIFAYYDSSNADHCQSTMIFHNDPRT